MTSRRFRQCKNSFRLCAALTKTFHSIKQSNYFSESIQNYPSCEFYIYKRNSCDLNMETAIRLFYNEGNIYFLFKKLFEELAVYSSGVSGYRSP